MGSETDNIRESEEFFQSKRLFLIGLKNLFQIFGRKEVELRLRLHLEDAALESLPKRFTLVDLEKVVMNLQEKDIKFEIT